MVPERQDKRDWQKVSVWMQSRCTLLRALATAALLVVLLVPLAVVLEQGKRASELDAWQKRIGDMHVRHNARMERAPGVPVASMMDIEAAWAIEDTRQEAAEPLITEMHNGADELGYDRETRTFYCTIGSKLAQWPQLSLTMRGQDGVQAAWIDDYSYDFCADAVREGYRYEMMAYTDTEYEYIGVVFTGLPIVTLHVDDISQLDYSNMPARASVSGGGYAPIDTAALVHLRGGRFEKEIDKPSYRVEFHRLSDKGKDKKNDLHVLGMDDDSDWILVSNAGDATCVRNALGFDMWRKWNEEEQAHALLESRMVELFVQDTYMGLYQLMERIDEEDELEDSGANLQTDAVARLIGERFDTGRPVSTMSLPIDGCLELRHAPDGMGEADAFALFEDYVTLNLKENQAGALDDAAFAQLAQSAVDIEAMISYYLYMNVCSLPYDNVKNNVYIWAKSDGTRPVYTLSPWDMDTGFRPMFSDDSDSINMWMTLPVRMLKLNVGNCREMMHELWRQKRSTILTDDAIYQWVQAMEEEINASGAYLRESERWRGGAKPLNLAEISSHTTSQLYVIERYMQENWKVDPVVMP